MIGLPARSRKLYLRLGFVRLNPAVAAALRESDVVLGVCDTRIGQSPECHEALKAGTRILLTKPGPRPGFLIDGLLNIDYTQPSRRRYRRSSSHAGSLAGRSKGCGAVAMGCLSESGVAAARELCRIPVVGEIKRDG